MKNKTAKFLILSIVCIFALCVVVFSLMTYVMNKRGAEAIGELGTLYMSGMSEQAATHFGTTIELRLSQVGALSDAVPPPEEWTEGMEINLNSKARQRGFTHLALCRSDGTFEMLYGRNIQPADPQAFLLSLSEGEENMSAGTDTDGNNLVLMGIPAAYPMESGEKSVGLVAALSTSYIKQTLSLDSEDSLIYYFIINRDGEFIIRDDDITDETYFQRVLDKYENVNGMSGERYIEELEAAMANNENYTNEFRINGERRFLYCTGLPFSDWYLILLLPYGQLDRTVNALNSFWVIAAVLSCLVIIAAFGIVFAFYLRATHKQVRDLEEARSLAEYASKAKSEFLSNMSHDIRTPMNGIVGMTAIAAANLDNKEQVSNCLKKIDLSSRHLLGLINDILDMSKIESGKLELHMERVSIKEIIKNVLNIVQPQASAKSQRLDVYIYDGPCGKIISDSVRMSQILLNLLGNAVKFTPDGGRIILTCREESSPKGENFARVRLSVKDTGIGMTEEFRGKIFDAFAREDTGRVQKTEGTGLGMAITKYIVDAMHGTIDVESQLNVGSEFTVCLDLEKAAPDVPETDLNGKEILVADGDGLFIESLMSTLSAAGCIATPASDGASALKAVKEHGKNPFYAVLLDANLDGMQDLSLVRDIVRESGGNSIVLLMSASDKLGFGDQAAASGIAGVISKPVFRADLSERFGRISGGAEEKTRGGDYDFRGKRVLLAEDNDLNREIAEELLSEAGIEVDSAEDGKICADKFAASPEGYYDAVLMDIRMPVMSGYDATRAIRAMERADAAEVPIIAMSADAFSEDVKRCLECGMNAHIAKPIDMEVVSRVLSDFFKK